MSKNNKSSLFSLFLVVFIDMLGIGIIIPILPIIFYAKDFFPASVPQSTINILLGLLIASYPLAQFFAAPVLGKYSDRYGRKNLLIISLIGSLLGYALFAVGIIIGNIYILFLSRIIDGVTGGNISIVNSAIADISDVENKTKNFGLIGMAFGLGFIFGPFIGGVLSDSNIISWFNLATPFWTAALLVFINIMFIIFSFKESIVQKVHKPIHFLSSIIDIRKIISLKSLNIFFLTIFLINFGWSFFTQFFQIFLYDKFSFTSTQIGYLFAYMGLWIAISQGVLIRPISKKFKSEKILKIVILLTSLTLLTFIIPSQNYILYLIIPILAISFGFINPNFSTIISNSTTPTAQGEILGLRQSVVSLSQAIPPILAGISLSISTSMPIIISSAVLFIAWIVFFFLGKQTEQKVSLDD
ncbi:MFS transporter [Patescibacteria group bacterium]|nr:MFS transporter [Patescibacteria group bacterium]